MYEKCELPGAEEVDEYSYEVVFAGAWVEGVLAVVEGVDVVLEAFKQGAAAEGYVRGEVVGCGVCEVCAREVKG